MTDPTRRPMLRRDRDDHLMNLPAGTQCGDCRNFLRCSSIFGHIAADEVCDWAPSRFSVSPKVLQRLDDLMRRVREDRHELRYADLVAVRGGNG